MEYNKIKEEALINETIMEKSCEASENGFYATEEAAQKGYKTVEGAVVGGYKKIESAFVNGYNKVEDSFVNTFLKKDGEIRALMEKGYGLLHG